MVEPALSGPTHRVADERLLTTPTPFSELWNDAFGNPQRRLLAPAGPFTFDFTGVVETKPNVPVPPTPRRSPPRISPADTLVYTLPSRYCQSDLLARMAQDEFGAIMAGGERVNAIAAWVRRHVGTATGPRTPRPPPTTRPARRRLPRFRAPGDLFCRALGVPARYASGYALGLTPPDFHGYAQVYLGGAWHNLDATFEGTRPALVPIAVGRDTRRTWR